MWQGLQAPPLARFTPNWDFEPLPFMVLGLMYEVKWILRLSVLLFGLSGGKGFEPVL